jgi:Tfp pilus assembly protein PilO
MIYRRQRQQYIFAALLAVIATVNLLFYFILNRPAEVRYRSLQESITRFGAQIGTSRQTVETLEKRQTQLSKFDQDRRSFLMSRFLPRKTGYSQILTELDEIVRRTGVRKTVVNLPLGEMQFGMHALAINLPVEGGYSNVVNFIREIEQSDTFLLINAIEVTSVRDTAQPAATAKISVVLGLETYFYQ